MHAKQQPLKAHGKCKTNFSSLALQLMRKRASLPKIIHLWKPDMHGCDMQ